MMMENDYSFLPSDFTFYHLSEEDDRLYLTTVSTKEKINLNESIFKGYNYKLMDVIHTFAYITNYYIEIDKSEIDNFVKSFGIQTVIHSDVTDREIPTNIKLEPSMYNKNNIRFTSTRGNFSRVIRNFYLYYNKYTNENNVSLNLFTVIKKRRLPNKIIISEIPMKDVV